MVNEKQGLLVNLGDSIDRGIYGIDILVKNMASPNILQILGNHEQLMLDFLTEVFRKIDEEKRELKTEIEFWEYAENLFLPEAARWIGNNGGAPTVKALRELPFELLEKIYQYLQQCPLAVEIKVSNQWYYLIHGSPAKNRYHMLWDEANPKKQYFKNDNITLIYGHIPTIIFQQDAGKYPEVYYGNHSIGIDTAAGYPEYDGRVSVLELDTLRAYYF